MTKPILVAVDPFREDPDPLSLATLLGELTGRKLVAVGAYPQSFLPSRVDVPAYRRAARDLALKGLEWAPARGLQDARRREHVSPACPARHRGGARRSTARDWLRS